MIFHQFSQGPSLRKKNYKNRLDKKELFRKINRPIRLCGAFVAVPERDDVITQEKEIKKNL